MSCCVREAVAPLCLDFNRCPGSRREVTAAGVQSAAPRYGASSAPRAGSLHNPAGTGSVPVAPGLQLPGRDLSPQGTAWATSLPPQPAGR